MVTRAGPRVAVIGPIPPPTHGAAVVTEKMAKALSRAGVAVDVTDTSGSGSRLPYSVARMRAHLIAVARILSSSATEGPRHLYVGGAGGLGLIYQVLLLLVARICGWQVYFHHHSSAYLAGRPNRLMSVMVYCGGPRLHHVTLSRAMTSNFRRLYSPKGETFFVSNARFVPEASFADRPLSARIRVGFLGAVTKAKGALRVVEIVDELKAEGLTCELELAGAPDGEVRAALAGRTEGAPVALIGVLRRSEVATWLSSLDLLLFPSTYLHEASPMVLFEALAVGTPVLASDVGSIPEILADSDWAVPVRAFHAEAKRWIREVVADPSGQAARRRSARRLFEKASIGDDYDLLVAAIAN